MLWGWHDTMQYLEDDTMNMSHDTWDPKDCCLEVKHSLTRNTNTIQPESLLHLYETLYHATTLA